MAVENNGGNWKENGKGSHVKNPAWMAWMAWMAARAWIAALVVLTTSLSPAVADGWRKSNNELVFLNQRLHGRLLDYTANHGTDNRIWSDALCQRRDLYVYLPPDFNPGRRYPLVLLYHGFALDEHVLFEMAAHIDSAICRGALPPVIVACPDGAVDGEPCLLAPGSFFINTRVGNFEDFVLNDLWGFLTRNFPIRPEREAHVLAGVSMGGFAVFNHGIRFRDKFGVVVGVYPAVNLRWVDQSGNYMANFDPDDWGWRTDFSRRREALGRFYAGLVTFRVKHFIDPLFGHGEDAIKEIMRQNPIELIDRLNLKNGELAMYIGYGGKDEFNIDAQVESFLYYCKMRGVEVSVGYEPDGRHDMRTALKLWPGIVQWLGPRLAPYAPK